MTVETGRISVRPTLVEWIVSAGEALLMVWSIPLIIVVVALPVVIVARVLLAIGTRLFGH